MNFVLPSFSEPTLWKVRLKQEKKVTIVISLYISVKNRVWWYISGTEWLCRLFCLVLHCADLEYVASSVWYLEEINILKGIRDLLCNSLVLFLFFSSLVVNHPFESNKLLFVCFHWTFLHWFLTLIVCV